MKYALYWGIVELFIIPVPKEDEEEAMSSFNFICFLPSDARYPYK
jgi:hypothetical protein